jgi:nucleoside 2-deoxyribosyltransferase
MRVYLAARFSRRSEMKLIRCNLEALNWTVTASWVDLAAEGTGAAYFRQCAVSDLRDLAAADCVIAFTEEPRSSQELASRGGRHVELGIAIGLGKRTLVVGPRENVFTFLPEIEYFESWPKALAAIRSCFVHDDVIASHVY